MDSISVIAASNYSKITYENNDHIYIKNKITHFNKIPRKISWRLDQFFTLFG